jgi:hypothetical protein
MNSLISTPTPDAEQSLSRIVISLLKGVIYQENDAALWNNLVILEPRVRDYVGTLNLELVLDEAEGFAFLRSREIGQEAGQMSDPEINAPRLYPRRPLSFPISLLLALLRKKLAEFDASGSGSESQLVLTREEITEIVRVFLPEQSNEARIIDQMETHLNKIAEFGFVRKLKSQPGATHPPVYEVRRILKAFVDAQWLADFDARLEAYRRHLELPAEKTNGG